MERERRVRSCVDSRALELCLLAVSRAPGDPVTSVARRYGDGHYYKHRCRYCRKGFHGDSALQIHIRSHTGWLHWSVIFLTQSWVGFLRTGIFLL